ncbi:hypothetical protein [Burkholderia sp. 22313]|uniref:hypothetical protein n=1 Tax=Burkholderia sp. 22313 TaxID=3453908 RepID=UPI003F86EF84
MLVLTQDQAGQVRRFTSSEHSALGDPSTACAVRSTGVNADGTQFALIGAGRNCFGGTAYALIEEIHALRNGQPRDRDEQQRELLTGSNRWTNLGCCRLGFSSKPDGISPASDASTGLLLQGR